MGIKSELHEAILKRGGKVPPYGGIAAAMDELNKLPGGGGDCDWNTMKNRPFGTEYGTIEVLGETTVAEIETGSHMGFLTTDVKLESGKKYVVTVDGTEYTCVANELTVEQGLLITLGDASDYDGIPTDDPFVVTYAPELYGAMVEGVVGEVGWKFDAASVTLSIHTEGEIVKQIDPKYIPGGAGGGGGFTVTVVANETMDGVTSADKTYEEVVSAFSGGIIPAVRMDMSGGVGFAYIILPLGQYSDGAFVFSMSGGGLTFLVQVDAENGWTLTQIMTE